MDGLSERGWERGMRPSTGSESAVRYRALRDPECGDCWLVQCDDEADPGIVAMCGQQRDADMVAVALNQRDALSLMLRRLLDVALVDGYGETVRDEAEAVLRAAGETP